MRQSESFACLIKATRVVSHHIAPFLLWNTWLRLQPLGIPEHIASILYSINTPPVSARLNTTSTKGRTQQKNITKGRQAKLSLAQQKLIYSERISIWQLRGLINSTSNKAKWNLRATHQAGAILLQNSYKVQTFSTMSQSLWLSFGLEVLYFERKNSLWSLFSP